MMLNGQKLQGPQTAAEVHQFLLSKRQEQAERFSATGNGVSGNIPTDIAVKTNSVHKYSGSIMNGPGERKQGPGKYPLFEAVWMICYEVSCSWEFRELADNRYFSSGHGTRETHR